MTSSALFVGDGTLLIRCAEVFREAGGDIAGVLSADPQIRAWAGSEGIACLGSPAAPDGAVPEADYLFSVANLSVLPADLLARARRMAVNFHDGPLPARSGLNVPTWALIEGARTHGVTWHEMTAAVDAGRILATRSFEIGPADTSFTLNARCYEAGIDSFREVVAGLLSGTLAPVPQVGPRVWYPRARRPDTLGTLDFARPSADLCRLVRGLNFGTARNPLALAKIWTGTALLTVARLEITRTGAGRPGAILDLDDASVTVGTADGAVRLSGIARLDGETIAPADAGLARGQVLPGPGPADAEAARAIGAAEPAWESDLLRIAPALPPYPRDHFAPAAAVDLAVPVTEGDRLAAAWLSWVAGLTGAPAIGIAVLRPAARPWLSPRLPLVPAESAGATPESATAAFTAARRMAEARAPMAADLVRRLVDPAARDRAAQALRVVFADCAADTAEADLVLSAEPPRIAVGPGVFDAATLDAIARDFAAHAAVFAARPGAPIATLPLGAATAADRGAAVATPDVTVHAAIARVAAERPEDVALEAGDQRLTHADRDRRVARLAGALAARGAGPGTIVGLCVERSADLVVAMLAILRTGAAYLPLDPGYPPERIAYMLADSGAPLVVASRSAAARLGLDPAATVAPDASGPELNAMRGGPEDLAYLIYTSGSTGQPKGVMIAHRNVAAFFAGMDGAVPLAPGARLLAVTSVSFDISVLEILWAMARGATVVLQTEAAAQSGRPDFSLFYFASEASGTGHHAYRLLLEGARFADENGFAAVWMPERHFHAFGGLYPNPAITAAAVAGITRNIKLRAGSSVVPLHHPVRVAEDWALVDNLSNGRAGIAIAAGWQPNDFLLRPETWAERKQVMLDSVETLRALWRGETLAFPGHDGQPVEVEIHPRPMQASLPLWLTAAGNPETFVAAGRLGCGVLTHLLGQTFEEVAEKIRSYRVARAEAGHEGPGHVVLMLHTFIGDSDEQVREIARGPMKSYLKSAVDLVRRAAWTFPTIVERAGRAGMTPQEMFEKEELSASDLDQLLDHAFERYYRTSGLFGTPESAREIVRKVAEIGVDEVGCLIDFGIDTDLVLANLPNIKALMDGLAGETGVGRKASVAEEIAVHGITHLQCTPSMASWLAADVAGRRALGRLDLLAVGGEALPPDLARALRGAMTGTLLNMYGPTETTVWSSVASLDTVDDRIPLGPPIAGTVMSVRSPSGRPLPDLVEGELWIGGAGVARGYWRRPDLTAERFVETPEGRFYRTGDLVRRRPDGRFDFLGRMDGQVKIRGHRIETGEIEAALAADPTVREAAVRAIEYGPGDLRLVAYVTPGSGRPSPEALLARLAGQLPDFMLPALVVVLDRMPLTPNGKVDRKALPMPTWTVTRGAMAEAETDLESAIAAIWRDALGLDEVSVTENFFDLGGHSLLVVQVQRRMKQDLDREVAITDLFRFPTIRAIANHLAGNAGESPRAADRGAARAAARLARLGRR
ncbi:MAG: MupA/Atu3671 family FMN-dependent luciferase-like monooxygenase [Pseudomonadota bacterium]